MVTPNRLMVMWDGSYEDKRHGSSMLANSNLLAKLKSHSTWWTSLLYVDPAFRPRVHLWEPFQNNAND